MLIDKVTLADFIVLNTKLSAINEEQQQVIESEEDDEYKNIKYTTLFVRKARIVFNTLADKSTLKGINPNSVDFLISWYNQFVAEFDAQLPERFWVELGLPEPELGHLCPIVFGQIIDAKMLVEAGVKNKTDKWLTVQYIMAIFLLGPNEPYNYAYTHEGSDQFKLCGMMSVKEALMVERWWNMLNEYMTQHYTLFQDSGYRGENNDNMEAHMDQWGWVNFLKNIAKTKAFDISGSGLNSIDCVRLTKASEVLIWASEEKDYSVASAMDTKAAYKND